MTDSGKYNRPGGACAPWRRLAGRGPLPPLKDKGLIYT